MQPTSRVARRVRTLHHLGAWLALLILVAASCAPRSMAAPDDTAARLAAAVRPVLDPTALAVRLRGDSAGGTSLPPRTLTAGDVGRVEPFRVLDQTQTPNVLLNVEAELRLVTPHAYWYVQRGRSVDADALARSAETFETAIYPTIQRFVASGRDLGPVSLLHGDVPGVAGYFNSVDLYPQWVYPESNERPLLYLSLNAVRPGTIGYNHTVSHELAHLFHYFVNRDEDTWIKEGLGELVQELVDAQYRYGVRGFLNRPSTQLTAWAHPPADVSVHYQASYLFLQYFLQRYGGTDILAGLLAGGGRGPSTIDAWLAANGRPERFDDVFRDWVVANLVQDRSLAQGQYGYGQAPEGRPRVTELSGPGRQDGRVPQYGTDYYRLSSPARLRFQGTPTAALVGADPPGGGAFWWSNRGDMLDTRLTRGLDLRGVGQATLTYDLRYDVEDDYDYGYVMVSTDGGSRWQPVAGRHTTTANPTGRNLGVGYNGKSGGSGAAQWVTESVDLTPFAGQQIMVRFEYVTDDSYNVEGVAVSRVAVPELGWQDDGGGWTAEGFVWVENAVPQGYAVQLVEYRGDQATVRQLPLDARGLAELDLPGLGSDLTAVVVAVSGLAPRTLQPARYTLDVLPLGS